MLLLGTSLLELRCENYVVITSLLELCCWNYVVGTTLLELSCENCVVIVVEDIREAFAQSAFAKGIRACTF